MLALLAAAAAMDQRRVAVGADGRLEVEASHLAYDLRRDAAGAHAGPDAAETIPYQLFLTSKHDSLGQLPEKVRANVDRIVEMNPKIDVIYLNDNDCKEFLDKQNPQLGGLFSKVTHGPFKSDICRTAWLALNGGWYMDMDIDMRMSFPSIVRPGTTLFAAWGTQTDSRDILNALLGVEKGSPILQNAVDWLASPEGQKGCMAKKGLDCGTKAIRQGLNLFAYRCGVQAPSRFGPDKLDACGQMVQLAKEIDLADPMQRQEANERDPNTAELAIEGRNISNFRGRENANKHFEGLNYAIIFPGPPSLVVGYSRFDACSYWGCEGEAPPPESEPSRPAPVAPAAQALPGASGASHWYGQIIQSLRFGGHETGQGTSQAQPWYVHLFPSQALEEKFAWLSSHAQWY